MKTRNIRIMVFIPSCLALLACCGQGTEEQAEIPEWPFPREERVQIAGDFTEDGFVRLQWFTEWFEPDQVGFRLHRREADDPEAPGPWARVGPEIIQPDLDLIERFMPLDFIWLAHGWGKRTNSHLSMSVWLCRTIKS